jgi:cyclophilin family peptidyl-prolyl cis-trans isomerase
MEAGVVARSGVVFDVEGPSSVKRVLSAALLLAACTKTPPTSTDAAAPVTGFDPTAIAKAEDRRRAKDVLPEVRTSHDVTARRRAARALARIADASSVEGLTQFLSDDDAIVTAWGAYGLGYACKGREDAAVRALAARAASFQGAPTGAEKEIDGRNAIARAIGRCNAPLSEDTLVGLARGEWMQAALLGLGDLATRKKQLGPNAMTALLDAAADNELAFYALSRAEPGEAFAKRVADVAKVGLANAKDGRILAIRALGRAGKDNAADLVKVVADGKTYSIGERAEAARALGTLNDGVSEAIVQMTPDGKDAVGIQKLVGADFNVFYTLLSQLNADPPKKVEASLQALATLSTNDPRGPEIRCTAALGLAKGAYDADVLKKCDAENTETWEKARLTALLRRQLTKDRLVAYKALAKSEHLRIREDAVEGIGNHPEIGDSIGPILVDALTSKHAGLVATAAELLNTHPERALTLAESEKKNALDPHAPPPSANPAQELMPSVGKALAAAMAEKWPEDRFETRTALLDAAASTHIAGAKAAASNACNDSNPVIREHALKALRTIGADIKACDAPDKEVAAAAEIGKTIAKPAKVQFLFGEGDAAHSMSITLDPELSPITATRILALAKSGFYKGVVVHRVVPGFVAQFGDPDGDGYGGSGTSLRCETSPVPFKSLDVGMALSGRDTGSSQMFVTLSRTPHLEGEYTRVGHADGPWESIAQGDVIKDTRVEE